MSWTPSAAVRAAGRRPHGRWLCTRAAGDLAGARLPPLGAADGSRAAPSGLGAAWRWPTATPGPVGASEAHLMCRNGRVHACDWC